MTVTQRPSPNFNARRLPISMLVLHYTGMQTGAVAIERLCDPDAQVSAHYVVAEDGQVLQLVDESQRAWHAGVGVWRGCADINSASIGIEIVNGGHEFGLPDFPEAQMQAVIALCRGILARHPIAPINVIGHSDLAPDRKQDPGEKFPWKQFALNGVGLWPEPAKPGFAATEPGDDSRHVAALRNALSEIGYGIEADGAYDDALKAVVLAFQRRFRPDRLSGLADEETCALIEGLRTQVTSVTPQA